MPARLLPERLATLVGGKNVWSPTFSSVRAVQSQQQGGNDMVRIALLFFTLVLLFAAFERPAAAQEKAATRSAPAASAATKSPVNINTATVADFETLPGIGARTAARIIEYRQKNGPFKKIEELMNVRGVGEKSFLRLKAQLTVGPAKTDHDHQQ
jgi:competence protein ComEA